MFIQIAENKLVAWSKSEFQAYTKEVSLDYDEYMNYPGKYIFNGSDFDLNPNYEEEQRQKDRERKDRMKLTPADVERALYKAKNMDFEDLKELISQSMTGIDLKALAIEFRAKDFYRGAMYGNNRLFDVVGELLGYTPEDIDYLFENKELPESLNIGE